jgi:hypothetical protein
MHHASASLPRAIQEATACPIRIEQRLSWPR